ncbi:hypothetical protein [Kosakonia sp. 1610]|uniref:hypothetical protein n=1 Tax=Kosakonia sp. 1610 TaxID=3156426 RepID=UPI003D1E2456
MAEKTRAFPEQKGREVSVMVSEYGDHPVQTGEDALSACSFNATVHRYACCAHAPARLRLRLFYEQ